jgi:cytidylate kinase
MKCSVERLIEALVGIELAQARKAAEEKAIEARKASYVITISRSYGSHGHRIGQALADRLGVRCCDRAILEGVAKRAIHDDKLLDMLNENLEHVHLKPWQALFKNNTYYKAHYMRHVVKVVLNISKKGGVIVGRGAHLILGPGKAFRIRIVSSLDVSARRVAERKQLGLKAARKLVKQVNRRRAGYLQELFGKDINDCSSYDLVINTDRFDDDSAINLILHGLQQAGYEIPEKLMQSA